MQRCITRRRIAVRCLVVKRGRDFADLANRVDELLNRVRYHLRRGGGGRYEKIINELGSLWRSPNHRGPAKKKHGEKHGMLSMQGETQGAMLRRGFHEPVGESVSMDGA